MKIDYCTENPQQQILFAFRIQHEREHIAQG